MAIRGAVQSQRCPQQRREAPAGDGVFDQPVTQFAPAARLLLQSRIARQCRRQQHAPGLANHVLIGALANRPGRRGRARRACIAFLGGEDARTRTRARLHAPSALPAEHVHGVARLNAASVASPASASRRSASSPAALRTTSDAGRALQVQLVPYAPFDGREVFRRIAARIAKRKLRRMLRQPFEFGPWRAAAAARPGNAAPAD